VAARLRALEGAVGDRTSAEGADVLRRHVQACAPCQRTFGARVAALASTCALRSRQVPAGLLDDLRTRVLTQVRSHPGGGMSPAFLDAPASLARWRGVAMAASVLLVAGVALVASGRLALAPERPETDRVLRDALLPRLDARNLQEGDDILQPVLLPGRGVQGFYPAHLTGPKRQSGGSLNGAAPPARRAGDAARPAGAPPAGDAGDSSE